MNKKSLENSISDLTRKFGKLCLDKRRELGISINKLAQKANVSLGALSAFENGTNAPSVNTLLSITNALNLEDELCNMILSLSSLSSSSKSKQSSAKELEKALIKVGLPPEKIQNAILFINFLIDN